MDDLTRNLAAVWARIAAAVLRSGRHPEEVRLLPVSKTVPEQRIRLAVQAGCCEFGENKVQEVRLLRELPRFTALRVQGLMTLAVFSADADEVRACFARLRGLRDRVREDDPDLIGPGGLSMGMSGDYEAAIEEGATVIRVGQAIFGARPLPDSHYWPGIGTSPEAGAATGPAAGSAR